MKFEKFFTEFLQYNRINQFELFNFIIEHAETSGKKLTQEQTYAVMHIMLNGIVYYDKNLTPNKKWFDLNTAIRLYCKNHNITINIVRDQIGIINKIFYN